MASLFGSKKPPTVSQTNSIQYSPQQQQLFDMAFPMAQQFAQQGVQLPGTTIAGFNPLEVAGQQGVLQGGQTGQQIGQNAASSLNFLLSPDMLSPNTNPYLAQQGAAISDQMTDTLLQRVMPALRSGFTTQGGAYGGGFSKEGIAQGVAAGESAEAQGAALSNLFGNAYQQGLGTMLGANQLVPSIQGAQTFGGQAQAAVGEQQRAMEQANLDAQNQASIMNQIMPLLMAQQLYGFGMGMPGASQVNTATGAVPGGPGILGGAAGGAMAGSTFGMPGAVIGGGLGALLGAFS